MSGGAKTNKDPYPYEILPFQIPTGETFQGLSSDRILEFFRIEALLRSKKVHAVYSSKEKQAYIDLFMQTGFRWSFLEGKHHKYIDTSVKNILTGFSAPGTVSVGYCTKEDWEKNGILDKSIIDMRATTHRFPDQKERTADAWKSRLLMSTSKDPYMYLQIDPSYPPSVIINALRPILEKNHYNKRVNSIPIYSLTIGDKRYWSMFWVPRSSPTRKLKRLDVKTWLDYFRCYDLRHSSDLTFGQISDKVYQQPENRDKAEKAFYRVKAVIEAAETSFWNEPPSQDRSRFDEQVIEANKHSAWPPDIS